jgi:hypothetical protein
LPATSPQSEWFAINIAEERQKQKRRSRTARHRLTVLTVDKVWHVGKGVPFPSLTPLPTSREAYLSASAERSGRAQKVVSLRGFFTFAPESPRFAGLSLGWLAKAVPFGKGTLLIAYATFSTSRTARHRLTVP